MTMLISMVVSFCSVSIILHDFPLILALTAVSAIFQRYDTSVEYTRQIAQFAFATIM